MNTLWLLPIEPIAERYTKEWYDYLPSVFNDCSLRIHTIDGCETSGTIKTGSFLDANETVAYKSTQLARVAHLFAEGQVNNGDTFFVYDIEFWGIEVLRVLARMNNLEVRLVGFLHACSYTKGDAMEQMADFQHHTERGWFEAFDKILVGSTYQRDRLANVRGVLLSKIAVTGNPLFEQAYPQRTGGHSYSPREKLLVISNRFDAEKKPDESLAWALVAHHLFGYRIVVTTSRKDLNSNSSAVQAMAESLEAKGVIEIRRGQTKQQYHTLLTQARVVLTNSEEESFGYCIHEAQLHGAIVIAKPYACHPEFVQPNMLADSPSEFCRCLSLLETPATLIAYASVACATATHRMAQSITAIRERVLYA